MKWIVLDDSCIPSGSGIQKIKVEGRLICIIRADEQVYATSARCPHAGADLSHGWCEDGKLICPYHRHAFLLETGKGDPGQGNYIQVYPTELRNGSWYVGIKPSWKQKISRLFLGKK